MSGRPPDNEKRGNGIEWALPELVATMAVGFLGFVAMLPVISLLDRFFEPGTLHLWMRLGVAVAVSASTAAAGLITHVLREIKSRR